MPFSRLGTFIEGSISHACETESSPIEARLVPWRQFDQRSLIATWDTLAADVVEPNPFYESWYLLPSLRALAADDSVQLLVLEADGKLVGLMPLKRESGYYGKPLPHLRNWVHPNCFLGLPLVARGFERQFWRSLLACCDSQPGFALFLHLTHLPAEGVLHDALAWVLQQQDRPAATVHREERAMLQYSGSADDYVQASLGTGKRKELRRQHRRLSEEGELTVERLTDYSDIAGWTREFLTLEVSGWKGKAGSALGCDTANSNLFTYAVAGAAARGKLERIALRLNGRPLAMLANFMTPPGAYAYKTAFDESFARFSPGVLLQLENFALPERDDIHWVDSCAAQDHPMIDHLWRERRTIQRHSIGIGGALRRKAFRVIARRETGQPAGGIA